MTSPRISTARFWRGRLAKHGHTGWADEVIYKYDQAERLQLIRSVLHQYCISPCQAIDFGCGTGDFSRLLLKLGYTVCGYDPFVEPRIASSRFRYADSYAALTESKTKAGLILSVTVLDHLLEEEQAREALRIIRHQLVQGGTLCLLEYALDDCHLNSPQFAPNSYQAFRSLRKWNEILNSCDLRVINELPAPHPMHNPSKGYLRYKRGFLARAAPRVGGIPILRSLGGRALGFYARIMVKKHPPIVFVTEVSPLKLLICR